jgi:hypothetical protein
LKELLVLVPVLGAPLAHAPVLRFDLLTALKQPLDGGATVRGRRVLGDNKTVRGALVMFAGVLAATLALSQWDPYWSRLPGDVREAGPLLVGSLLGAGTVLGELPNSFLKRQLDIAPGARGRSFPGVALSVWDQVDFVPAVVVLLAPVWVMPMDTVLLALAVVAAVHFALNLVGYAIGARTAPV